MFLYAKEYELMLIHFGITHEDLTGEKTEQVNESNTSTAE